MIQYVLMMNILEVFTQGYEEMYLALFRSVTEAIEILQKAQQTTEEMYMQMEEAEE